jgi:hypothetical protein
MPGFASAQRDALIAERGQPILQVEFDVFSGNKVSMWCHLDHSANFNEVREQLLAMRDHLDNFIRDGAMCPYRGNG